MSRYAHLSREALIAALEERDQHPYAHFPEPLTPRPVTLEEVPELSCGAGPHQIIEGDNLDVLHFLQRTHQGQVGCIVIDPPYNTGNRDFPYHDDFTALAETHSSSAWLAFMAPRLTLAARLLRPDGALLVSIGEREHAALQLLLGSLMPGGKVGTFVVKTRIGAGDATGRMLSTDHEYVVCYGGPEFRFGGRPRDLKWYANPDRDPRGPWKRGDLTCRDTLLTAPGLFYPLHDPRRDVWYAPRASGVWRFTRESMAGRVAEGRVLFLKGDPPFIAHSEGELYAAIEEGKAPVNLEVYLHAQTLPPAAQAALPPLSFWVGKRIGFKRPAHKRFYTDGKSQQRPLSTLILNTKSAEERQVHQEGAEHAEMITSGYTAEGSTLLREILPGTAFPYPKPLALIENLIEQATRHLPGALVLDFFAGSGTTAHAVLSLNARDGGTRTFMLINRTEACMQHPDRNVCRDVTALRMRRVTEGYVAPAQGHRPAARRPGLGGGFTYLRVTEAGEEG